MSNCWENCGEERKRIIKGITDIQAAKFVLKSESKVGGANDDRPYKMKGKLRNYPLITYYYLYLLSF